MKTRLSRLLPLVVAGCSAGADDLGGPESGRNLDGGAIDAGDPSPAPPDAGLPPFACEGAPQITTVTRIAPFMIIGSEAVAFGPDWVAATAQAGGGPKLFRYSADLATVTEVPGDQIDDAWFGPPHLMEGADGFIDAVVHARGPARSEVVRYHRLDGVVAVQSRVQLAPEASVHDLDESPDGSPAIVTTRALSSPQALVEVVHGSQTRPLRVPENVRNVRIVPRAGIVSYVDDNAIYAWPYLAIDQALDVWGAVPCANTLIEYGIAATETEVFIAASCFGPDPEVVIERRDHTTGELLATRTIALSGRQAVTDIALDGVDNVVVAAWTNTSDAPQLYLMEPRNFLNLRAPVDVPWPDTLPRAVPAGVELGVHPERPAEVALAFTTVLGHGAGDLHLARATLCTP